tara:strand:- start:124 stop:780 length:657 start_codon:yes stop_codon:yes gene_type:complete
MTNEMIKKLQKKSIRRKSLRQNKKTMKKRSKYGGSPNNNGTNELGRNHRNDHDYYEEKYGIASPEEIRQMRGFVEVKNFQKTFGEATEEEKKHMRPKSKQTAETKIPIKVTASVLLTLAVLLANANNGDKNIVSKQQINETQKVINESIHEIDHRNINLTPREKKLTDSAADKMMHGRYSNTWEQEKQRIKSEKQRRKSNKKKNKQTMKQKPQKIKPL